MEPIATFIQTFVEADRQERYIELSRKLKRRRDFVWEIAHLGRHLRYDLMQTLRAHEATLSSVSSLLKSMKAGDTCFVVASTNSEIDNREMRTDEALAAVVGTWEDSLIFFPEASVAYYVNHDGIQRVLRPKAL